MSANVSRFIQASIVTAALVGIWLVPPSIAHATVTYNWTGTAAPTVVYIGTTVVNGTAVARACATESGSEHAYALAFSGTLSDNVVFNIATVSNQQVFVIFIRDGINEPDANHDCGYTAAQWTNLSFSTYSVSVNLGGANDWILGPNTPGNVIAHAGAGYDRIRIFYHAGSYDGDADGDEIYSEWYGDSSTGETMVGGDGPDLICDRNQAWTSLTCNEPGSMMSDVDDHSDAYPTVSDCDGSWMCSYPGSLPTLP